MLRFCIVLLTSLCWLTCAAWLTARLLNSHSSRPSSSSRTSSESRETEKVSSSTQSPPQNSVEAQPVLAPDEAPILRPNPQLPFHLWLRQKTLEGKWVVPVDGGFATIDPQEIRCPNCGEVRMTLICSRCIEELEREDEETVKWFGYLLRRVNDLGEFSDQTVIDERRTNRKAPKEYPFAS